MRFADETIFITDQEAIVNQYAWLDWLKCFVSMFALISFGMVAGFWATVFVLGA